MLRKVKKGAGAFEATSSYLLATATALKDGIVQRFEEVDKARQVQSVSFDRYLRESDHVAGLEKIDLFGDRING